MKLRIFPVFHSSDGLSIGYSDHDCTAWECMNGLLVVHSIRGTSYLPLVGIKSFREVGPNDE